MIASVSFCMLLLLSSGAEVEQKIMHLRCTIIFLAYEQLSSQIWTSEDEIRGFREVACLIFFLSQLIQEADDLSQ